MANSNSSEAVEDYSPQALVSEGEKEEDDISQYNLYGEAKEPKPMEAPEPSPHKSIWRRLFKMANPDWFLEHINFKDLKLVLQTYVQVWASIFLCIVPMAERWVGNACYLFQILAFIMANGGFSVVINVIVSLACVLYICIGWLFLTVASAITAHLRGWPSQESVIRDLIEEGTCTLENAELCYPEVVATGRYLETRCTIIWVFAFLISFTGFGMTQRLHPLGRLPFVAGVITIVILIVNFVSFPTFLGWSLVSQVMKPMLLAFAFKIACAFVIIPFTSSVVYVRSVIGIQSTLAGICEKNSRFFKTLRPSLDSFNNHQQLNTDVQATRVRMGPAEMFLTSARWEVSFGRFDPGDLAEIRSKVKPILTVVAGFKYFYELVEERKDLARDGFTRFKRRGSLSSQNSTHNKLLAAFRHTYAKVGVFETEMKIETMKRRAEMKGEHEIITLNDLDRICDATKSQYSDFLEEIPSALRSISSWLTAANDFRTYSIFRWSRHVERQKVEHEKLCEQMRTLETEMGKLDHADEYLKALANDFEGEEQKLCLISQSSLLLFFCKDLGNQILSLMRLLLELDESRPTPRIIHPFSRTVHDSKVTTHGDLLHGNPSDAPDTTVTNVSHVRDPDVLDPTNLYEAFVIWFFGTYKKLYANGHMWFWVRAAILTQLCCFPYYFRPSAHFYTTNRLIWLPITCGVSVADYTAETIYMFLTKLVYSLVGCVAGLVGWYISTGSGRGNYYGYGVVTAVIYFFAAYYRQFAVHHSKMAGIMVAVTPVLVLGTSWADTRAEYPTNIGVGWRPAVARYVSVVIGLAVALLASSIPKPRSSKVAVRVMISSTMESSSEMFCEISDFALKRLENPEMHIKSRHDRASDQMRGLLLSLAHARAMMGLIKYEAPFTGRWPAETYGLLQTLVNDVIQLYYLLYISIDQVEDPEEWIPIILTRVGWTDHVLVAETLSLTDMAASSLRRRAPLPKITNANLSSRHFDAVRKQWGAQNASLNERFYEDWDKTDDGEDQAETLARAEKVVNYKKLLSHDGQLNIVCLLLSHLVYKKIDEIVITVKTLVGEKYDVSEELFHLTSAWD